MKVREQAIKELSQLTTMEILKVYNLILSLKDNSDNVRSRQSKTAYLRVREALKNCKGSLSEDILTAREDRI
ncbi:MAG: hypothetical protein GTO45_02330 [Candidatus Aminicenantes bacterium]|nr:hypothetical protein [Candidatus Aminicenantes bacterium]NIM77560.1 hypothetical protein [Candidatus Aminicenantes bacterium]NIN16882.1 hypothetical protein [Candidatus Aminicenantes bacterium]NIN40770.1 hypothetical protein [Candidatus Aminicenantes bacterium]NIN83579.1 hypothetical protein [Candidatus Aminicenantes bacterium]